MKEIKVIVEAYQQLIQSKKKGALATVVKVEGSSYRRAGARMLMTEDGHWTGAISGGCLEGDALRKSRKVMLEGIPQVVTYDTMQDDSAQSLGVGLGCNGIIHVLLEPLKTEEPNNPIEMLRDFLPHRKPAFLATVFGGSQKGNIHIGERWMLQADGSIINKIQHPTLAQKIQADLPSRLAFAKSKTQVYLIDQEEITVFLEVLHPSLDLIIFGSGFDAVPVVKLANELGWHILVTDDCAAKVIPSRFPEANEVKLIHQKELLQQITPSPYTAALVMSHNYKYDIGILEKLLQTDIRYIGLLGPKKRFLKMQTEWQSKGLAFDYSAVHSPVGLDIGAETPTEIALAIISEIQAFFQNKKGGFLKQKEGFIHDRQLHQAET
jgi:xanthine/CO dehydrogenase XdhC/CoxF family maturation factor